MPTMAEAHANLCSIYKDSCSALVEAFIKSYKQVLLLWPEFPEVTCNILHTLPCVCSWENHDKMFLEVERIIKRQINMSVLPSVQPFHAIAYPIGPLLALKISYVSNDFDNHPLPHLMGSVFGMHNREHVEVFYYALSPNNNTKWSQHIQFEAEHFVDVSAILQQGPWSVLVDLT
ncbi:probable UDP-N-acetylglucosamine--peptide N-acetylglucosaminyltransferase SEC [Benincasa hispida]|uniref:probable UDP-N-acetylglucosamine--peptide N-acetylglucosaminyltransferase SEC n=1 Tax=Benincasa hispida TaxID=102211 RepID=UPI00190278EF|nr:probable UDP-N-acetylglucosamine--peptide N-acetylglucosaminyltransferase SEC [Benincasa hispida]